MFFYYSGNWEGTYLVLATCLEGKIINIKHININCLSTGGGDESDTSKTPHEL
jgi:hypothetical protein